jgi:hypothetical protein
VAAAAAAAEEGGWRRRCSGVGHGQQRRIGPR